MPAEMEENINRMTQQLESIHRKVAVLEELKDDMNPIMKESFNELLKDLDSIKHQFSAQDLLNLFKMSLANVQVINKMLTRMAVMDEFFEDSKPIIDEAVRETVNQLDTIGRFQIEDALVLTKKTLKNMDVLSKMMDRMVVADQLFEDCKPIIDEAVRETTNQLEGIGHFQIEDALVLTKKTLRNMGVLTKMMDRMAVMDELFEDSKPIIDDAVRESINFMDGIGDGFQVETALDLTKKSLSSLGTFSRLLDVLIELEKNGTLDTLLELIEKATDPKVIKFLSGTLDALCEAECENPKKVNMFGMMGALNDPKMQETLGILLDIGKKLPDKVK